MTAAPPSTDLGPTEVDALIVGAGPAGAACALWLHQAGLKVLLVEQAPQAMALLRQLTFPQEWVLGQPGVCPSELAVTYAAHLQNGGVPLLSQCQLRGATRLAPAALELNLLPARSVRTRALVLATGLQPRRLAELDAPGVLDAIGLSQRRDDLPVGRTLLLGGGDNAIENASHLAALGHAVTLWSRSALRGQPALMRRMTDVPHITQRVGVAMPTDIRREDKGGFAVQSAAFGVEHFDHVALLLGFEPNMSALRGLQDSSAWRDAGWPESPPPDWLEGQGIYLAGDVSQRLHPSISTAQADGIDVARRLLSRLRDNPGLEPTPMHTHCHHQTISIAGLRFDANLGILDHERVRPQPIQVDAELNQGPQPLLPHDDDIGHVLDYRKVRQIIIDECTAEHVNLLESLIGKLSDRLLRLPGVVGVRVKIAKLEIFDDCEVAIRMQSGQW